MDDGAHAELAEAGRNDEPGHPAAGDDQGGLYVRLNVGLCSTYSMRTRSGPTRKAA